jgi:hypothetical protein
MSECCKIMGFGIVKHEFLIWGQNLIFNNGFNPLKGLMP